ncbi:MAG: putative toxin-antitoxin system toxin component, PIN family [Terracidiphilus sp.]|jgi:putative PIN family toxin of toxin-antitoxin system
MGSGADGKTLMLVLLDSNIYFSALISPQGSSARIVSAWKNGRFYLLTCQQQINEISAASRNPKFRALFQPHQIGSMLNHLYKATVWPDPLPHKHVAADPTDSYLLNLIDAAQPDYAVTGDKRSGLLRLDTLGRTKILGATAFLSQVLHQ